MEPETLPPGTRFGAYEIVRPVGRGGMGAVYEARHTTLEKVVALKVLSRQYALSPEACERFVREGKAASKIRHPHIVDVSDLGVSNDAPYLVMEYLEGEDLSDLIDREGTLSPAKIAEVMVPVLSALQAAHDHQIVHRDLKPENIFLARTALETIEPKVLDFGIAKLGAEKGLTDTAVMMGTVHYMSPEQVHSTARVGPASDQFSVGVILYLCATGKRPFDSDNVIAIIHAIATGDFVPPRSVKPDISPELDTLILRAMAYDPANRFPSAREFGRALLKFADDDVRTRWGKSFGEASAKHGADRALPTATTERPPPAAGPPTPLDAPDWSAKTRLSTPTNTSGTLAPLPPTPRWPMVAVGLGLAAVVAVAVTLGVSDPDAPVAPVTAPPEPVAVAPPLHLTASPEVARFTLDGRELGQGAIDLVLPDDDGAHTLVVSADGFTSREIDLASGPPPTRIELTAAAAPPPIVSPSIAAPEPPPDHEESPRPPATRPPRAPPTVPSAPPPTAPTAPSAEVRGANGALIIE